MTRRSPARRLADLIGAAYAFGDVDAFRHGTPRVLREAVPADVGSYNAYAKLGVRSSSEAAAAAWAAVGVRRPRIEQNS